MTTVSISPGCLARGSAKNDLGSANAAAVAGLVDPEIMTGAGGGVLRQALNANSNNESSDGRT